MQNISTCGSRIRKEAIIGIGQKRQKVILPFLPDADYCFTSTAAPSLSQGHLRRSNLSVFFHWAEVRPKNRLPSGALRLHHCELDLGRILFGVVDGLARDDAF